jgi:hypothetical protein
MRLFLEDRRKESRLTHFYTTRPLFLFLFACFVDGGRLNGNDLVCFWSSASRKSKCTKRVPPLSSKNCCYLARSLSSISPHHGPARNQLHHHDRLHKALCQ